MEKDKMTKEEIKREVIKYSNRTINLESEREDRIEKSTYPILLVDMISIFTLQILGYLMKNLNISAELITISMFILEILIALSLMYMYLASDIFKYSYTKTGKEFMEHINNHYEQYSKEEAYLDQEIHDNDLIIESMRENNNKKSRYLKKARQITITYMIGIFIVIIMMTLIG